MRCARTVYFALPDEVITIPVVVHLVQINGKPNLSKAVIEQQIAALTRDFRRKNMDELAQVPEAFRYLAADTRIQFVLAHVDPEHAPTEGIVTRASNRSTPFTFEPLDSDPQKRNPVKFAASGGSDAWPSDRYLNLWVCALAPELGEGYAAIHGDFEARPAEDGVVISADYFGQGPAGRNKGRTLTNLVAKWAGLNDIWGNGDVAGSDGVADTPPQQGPNGGCPKYPCHNRAESPYGDMFMNFMDATDDDCRVMFTAGQADRMYAGMMRFRPMSFFGQPMFFFLPVGGGGGGGINADYVIRDYLADGGDETIRAPAGTEIYRSPDIAVNPTSGNMTFTNPNSGASVYVNVRIFNYGGASAVGNRNVTLYYQKNSVISALPPTGWIQVGAQAFNHSASGSSVIVPFPWTTPVVGASAPAADKHYCFVAVISNETCAPAPARACNSGLWAYTDNNNNVGWRNVDIIGTPGQKMSGVRFGNIWNTPSRARLEFATPLDQESVFKYGKVVVTGKRLLQLWEQGGRQGDGVEQRDTQLVLTKEGAFIGNLPTEAGEMSPIELHFEPRADLAGYREVYGLNLIQSDDRDGEGYKPVGGQIFVLKTEHTDELPPVPPPPGWPWWWWLVAGLIVGVGIYGWRKMKQSA